ncbi:MAG: glycosyltransferase [Acidobacteriota bacterium]
MSSPGGHGDGGLIAWFGREYFAGSLRALERRLLVHSYHEPRLFTWEDILAVCGEAPQVLVLGDRSHPPPFLGLENYPCLTVFFSVDSHIHSWHRLYSQAFDACLVALKDDLPGFAKGRLGPQRLLWTPAFAPDPQHMPWTPVEPEWDVLFAGTVNRETTPGRVAFLEALGRELPGLEVRQGHFLELFPRGRVILNVAERGDLNYRVFEALAMGKPLLTPRIGNGLLDLFEDGVHLLTYAPGDAADCAAKARWLLEHPAEAEAMGRSGKALVDEKHRASHRGAAFAAFLDDRLAAGNQERLSLARALHENVLKPLHLHFAEISSDPAFSRAYLADARRR